MVANQLSIVIVIATITTLGSAKEFIVGDDKGWHFGVDYNAWIQGKHFYVGDKIVFNYAAGKHNVIEVDEKGFQQCIVPPDKEPLTCGKDVISLDAPGYKWFICGYGKHCEQGGMKLAVNVLPADKAASNALPATSGKEFVVGDEKGWTKQVDYQAWTKGKEFVVGDKLIFKYPVGKHNVMKVNETAYQKCMIPPAEGALSSGNDVVTLSTPGYEWYICGIGKHCEMGMKLYINVIAGPTSEPTNPQAQGGRKLKPNP